MFVHKSVIKLKHTSVDGEAINRHRGSHFSDVDKLLFIQASGGTAHTLRLAIHSEEICTPSYSPFKSMRLQLRHEYLSILVTGTEGGVKKHLYKIVMKQLCGSNGMENFNP